MQATSTATELPRDGSLGNDYRCLLIAASTLAKPSLTSARRARSSFRSISTP